MAAESLALFTSQAEDDLVIGRLLRGDNRTEMRSFLVDERRSRLQSPYESAARVLTRLPFRHGDSVAPCCSSGLLREQPSLRMQRYCVLQLSTARLGASHF
jgi:hypothetical protein